MVVPVVQHHRCAERRRAAPRPARDRRASAARARPARRRRGRRPAPWRRRCSGRAPARGRRPTPASGSPSNCGTCTGEGLQAKLATTPGHGGHVQRQLAEGAGLGVRPPRPGGRRAPVRAARRVVWASCSSSCSMVSMRVIAGSPSVWSGSRPLEPLLHAVEHEREALRQRLAVAVGEEAERGVMQRDERAAVLRA